MVATKRKTRRGKTAIVVRVTQRDIDEAPGHCCHNCPIHEVLARKVTADVHVFRNSVRIGDADIALPQKAAKFSTTHNLGEGVEPISFSLKVPTKLLKHGIK